MTFKNDRTNPNKPVTTDLERKITLASKPADQDGTYPFYLNWNSQNIKFSGQQETIGRHQNENGEWRFIIRWTITTIVIPPDFPESEDNICKTIKEALESYGDHHDQDRIERTETIISPHAIKQEWYE